VAGRKAPSEEDQISGWRQDAFRIAGRTAGKALEVKAAFATWHDRIAPLFDTSRHAHIVEAVPGRVQVERRECFGDDSPVGKVLCLVEWGVGTLVCGAISRPVQAIAAAHGIQVFPFIAGGLHGVVQAWLDGRIQDARYAMPGHGQREKHIPSRTILVLDLSRHCIETEIKRLNSRAVSDYFRAGKAKDKEAIEQIVALTQQALASLDFPGLRGTHAPLAGRTDARVELAKERGRLVIRIDGLAIASEDPSGAEP
jgi:hypothetical protein